MKNALKMILIVIVMNLILGSFISAQDKNLLNKLDSNKQTLTAQNILKQIESAVSSGDVSTLSPYLDSQTYLSLSNGIRGYYSANQAYYVLEDFFRIFRVISFRFDNINSDEGSPYATGTYYFEFKGKRNNANAYISVKKAGRSWKITQITIN